jgi:DNA-binding helix-hairpin-helix protein with protein kinase domain
MTAEHRLIDSKGRRILLGAKIARGGEGTVYAVSDEPALVAKIYHPDRLPDADKREKLQAMAAAATDRLQQLAAWPVELLLTDRNGPVVGFLMRRLAGFKEIHALYTPKTRLAEFPQANWQFLIHVARNLAVAMRMIHEHGHIVGDVNHGNIFVNANALVRLIDCDSFQIRRGRGAFLCHVGIATHTPPEMQGVSFADIPRTENHDLFGLAVVIFQLLFLGRHPYSGVYLGPGEMPIEEAIKTHRFAYARDAARRQMRPPPGGLTLDILSREAAHLFDRAFGPGGQEAKGRPTALEWIAALTAMESELQQCPGHSGHLYGKRATHCPWCAFEAASGKPMFNVVVAAGARAAFDLGEIVQELHAIPNPAPLTGAGDFPIAAAEPDFAAARAGDWRRVAGGIAAGVGLAATSALPPLRDAAPWITLAAIFAGVWIGRGWPARRLRAAARAALERAQADVDAVESAWSRSVAEFAEQRRRIEADVALYQQLPERRAESIRALAERREDKQRRAFLARHRIANYSIPGIGPDRKTKLQSFGIETALDVVAADMMPIPGFGPATVNHMLQWRRRIEARFRFDPGKGVDPAELRKIDIEHQNAIHALQARIQNGPPRLRHMAMQIENRRALLRARLSGLLAGLAQAKANLDAVS